VRTEIRAGRWSAGGVHTVVAGPSITDQRGLLRRAVWESGPGAVLDGVSASPLDDALRQNEVTLRCTRVLRIPLLGWRLEREAFMDQVERGLALAAAA
jgi:hypothetical protein